MQGVSALEISLEYPSEIELDDEFTVHISADSTEIYDVKVFVHKSEDEQIDRNEYISEIYDGDWKDSYLYIKKSFPEDLAYKIRVITSPGEREICARLRKSETSTFFTQCNEIKVTGSENSDEDEGDDEEDEDESEAEDEKQTEQFTSSNEVAPISKTVNHETQQLSSKPTGRIFLNSNLPKETKSSEKIITPEGNKRKFLIYGFTGFCVLIIALLAMKKL